MTIHAFPIVLIQGQSLVLSCGLYRVQIPSPFSCRPFPQCLAYDSNFSVFRWELKMLGKHSEYGNLLDFQGLLLNLLHLSPPLLFNLTVIFFGIMPSLSFSTAINLIFTETKVLFCFVFHQFTG